jgi:hypothetical protein
MHSFGQKIYEVKIKDAGKSLEKNWRSIRVNYGRAPYFKEYSSEFEKLFLSGGENLSDLNCRIIMKTAELLGLKTKFIKSSELPKIETKSTQALIDLTKQVGADTYISGGGGVNYLDMDLWNSTGLKIMFQKYHHPVYRQFNSEVFQPNMNILDLLFNCGDKSLEILVKDQVY